MVLKIDACKLSAKVSLLLDNPFPVISLCKFNHISVCFIQISTKVTSKQLIPFRDSPCFRPLGKFQHNIKISIKTTRVSSLFVSLWLWFKSQNKLAKAFCFKDHLKSGVVFKFQCGLCNESYYGECVRHLNVRIGEHIWISPLTSKKVKPVFFLQSWKFEVYQLIKTANCHIDLSYKVIETDLKK